MKTLFSKTVWAPGAIRISEWKYRHIKWVMLPLIDLLLFIAGLSAVFGGAPAISAFFPNELVNVYGCSLSLVALACFIGVAFPRLWPLELVGRSILLGLVTGYTISLIVLALNGDMIRSFVSYFALVAMSPIVWRISLLGSEWQARKTKTIGE